MAERLARVRRDFFVPGTEATEHFFRLFVWLWRLPATWEHGIGDSIGPHHGEISGGLQMFPL